MSAAAPSPRPPASEVEALQAALAASLFERVAEDGPALFRAARDRGDWGVASDAALCVGRAWSNLARAEDAVRWTQESAQAAQQLGDAERECVAWGQLAMEQARGDQLTLALEALGEMDRRLSAVHREDAVRSLLGCMAATLYGMGLTAPALQAYERALAIAEAEGEPGQVVTLRTNWLVVAHEHHRTIDGEDPTAALALARRMERELALLEPAVAALDAPRSHWRLAHVAAAVHAVAGRPGEAAGVLQRVLDESPALPPVLLSSLWLDLAKARAALGEPERSRDAAQHAAALADPALSGSRRSLHLQLRSEIAELLGRTDEALALHKRFHQRARAVLVAAVETRLEGSLARLSALDAVVENQRLKAQNQGLAEGVARMSALAATDPLTELFNRRGFEAELQRLGDGRAGRVLALIDVDHFKAINDRHGHATGDRVLRELARCLGAVLRPRDLLARHGGEEFALLLLELDAGAALGVLERMRAAVAAHDWSGIAPGLRVTVSAGAVRPAPDEVLADALQRADRLLYVAKHEGRDRIVCDLHEGADRADRP
ncbi:MAG: diguanylate cyclase [Rubrivivax sp.]